MQKNAVNAGDVDLWELHEAYAVTTLYNQRQLDTPWERTNVNGGAIALGHPVGMSGTRLIITLLKEMKRRNLSLGVASLCVGGGLGSAMVLERK